MDWSAELLPGKALEERQEQEAAKVPAEERPSSSSQEHDAELKWQDRLEQVAFLPQDWLLLQHS